MPYIEHRSRKEIAKALPEAISAAMASYKEFLSNEETGTAQDFKAHHDACKVAIAHIELLIKLVKWADISPEEDDGKILKMLDKAQEEIGKHHE